MPAYPPPPDPRSEAARALLGGHQVDCPQCPAPGCGTPLRFRQQACSGRCRAALSRARRAEAQAAQDREVRRLLALALATLEAAERLLTR